MTVARVYIDRRSKIVKVYFRYFDTAQAGELLALYRAKYPGFMVDFIRV